jgi:hypothetical protein
MKKFITSRYIIDNHTYLLSNYDAGVVPTFEIGHYNIDDINLKDKLLNWNHGYKNTFLWKSKNTPMLCGIESHYSADYFRYKMQEQLKYTNTEQSDSQLYNSWIHI